ncbi:hypothetical protein BGZ94_005909, partial [Podila epigama]
NVFIDHPQAHGRQEHVTASTRMGRSYAPSSTRNHLCTVNANKPFIPVRHLGATVQDTDEFVRRRDDSVDGLLSGLVQGDRYALARAITLVESSNPQHRVKAQELLSKILEREASLASQQSTTLANSTPELSKDTQGKDQSLRLGKSFRIGLSGPPGVGKSTFIESFGMYLVSQGHKVSVL